MNQVELKKRQVVMASYILGMLSFLILGNLIGELSLTYIAMAFECFWFVTLILTGKLADTLGKMIRVRTGKGQYKNASKLKNNILLWEFVSGVLGSVILIFIAEFLGKTLLGTKECIPIIMVLAPAVLARCMVSVLLGYFQAEGTELPTVISCIMRQICIFLFSLLFVRLFGGYGEKISALLRQQHFTSMYEGMGIALAIFVSEFLVLLFLFLVYRGSRGNEKKTNKEGMRQTDHFFNQIRMVFSNRFPHIVILVLGHLPIWLGMVFYQKYALEVQDNHFGLLYGKFLPVILLFMIPGMILLLSGCTKVVGCLKKEEQRFANHHFSGGFHIAIVYGIFVSVYVAIMAPSISTLVGGDSKVCTNLFRIGGFLIVLGLVAYYFNQILMMSGGKLHVILALIVENVVFVILMLVLLNKGKIGIYALLYAAILGKLVFSLITGFLVLYQMRLNLDFLNYLGIPIGVACVSGLVMMFLEKEIAPHLSGWLSLLICLVVGLVIYTIVIMLIHNFREQELSYVPGGKVIRMIGQILRVY